MMDKQQIMHIHGGTCFNTYEDFLQELHSWDFNLDGIKNKNRWSHNHEKFLSENDYEFIRPRMPNKENAHYKEWCIWFEKSFPYLKNKIILIGHSLGGIFIAKYLAENNFPFTIQQLHLVATPYDLSFKKKHLSDFQINTFPGLFNSQSIGEVYIYHSKDDDVVPYTESVKYHEQIPESHLYTFEDKGHFLGEEFPELFENIKKVSN